MTLGDRPTSDPAQDLDSHLGKVVRIDPDGSVPRDNPFVGRDGVAAGDLVYGIATRRPPRSIRTGALWEVEHGPARRRRAEQSRAG